MPFVAANFGGTSTGGFVPATFGAASATPAAPAPLGIATPQPQPNFFQNVITGAKAIGSDVLNALKAPAQPSSNGPFTTTGAYTVGGDIATTALNSYSNALNDAKTKLDAASALAKSPYSANKGNALGEATIGSLGVFFAPITAAIAGAEKIPVLGGIATTINNVFSAIGAGSADVALGMLDASNLSQKTKDTLTPFVRDAGALAGQILAGKGSADAYDALTIKAKGIIDTVNNAKMLADHVNAVSAEAKPNPSFQPAEFGNKAELAPTSSETAPTATQSAETSNVPSDAEHLAKAQTALQEAKGFSPEDIMAKHPDIQLKREVPATDIYGNKIAIPKGEALTPYELKGNKVLLQDGKTYIVSKNQYANIKGNAISGEAKPFAPELKGTEETVKGASKWQGDDLIDNGETVASLVENEDGTWSYQSDFSEGSDTFKTREEAMKEAEQSTVDDVYAENAPKYSSYQLPEGKNYKEILIKAPTTKGVPFKSSHWEEPNVISHLRLNERTYKGKKVSFMEELQSDWAREARANKTTATNPLLKNWQELSIKRALQEAVSNGSQYFSWINGEQTSARYNLATHIDEAKWIPSNHGEIVKNIQLTKKGGGDIAIGIDKNGIIKSSDNHEWQGKKLDEVLGKGLADKIMAEDKGTLSGEGLKFGGEWANNLYDKQVGNIVADLTGAKVETMDLGLPIDKFQDIYTIDGQRLKPSELKIGERVVKRGDENPYIITKVLGDGKFEAVPANKEITVRNSPTDEFTTTYAKATPKQKIELEKHSAETFDISTKKTTQQGIKITPEIKARILGEAPKIKASGSTDFLKASESTGKTPSGIGKSIERKAVEAGLTAKLDTIAGYDASTIKEQAKIFSDVIDTKGIDEARAMLRGEKPLAPGQKSFPFIVAMEDYLKNNPSADLAHELANSPHVSAASEAASNLGLGQNRVPDSFTAKINEIRQARIAKAGEKAVASGKTVPKRARAEMVKTNLGAEDLGKIQDFIDKIIC